MKGQAPKNNFLNDLEAIFLHKPLLNYFFLFMSLFQWLNRNRLNIKIAVFFFDAKKLASLEWGSDAAKH